MADKRILFHKPLIEKIPRKQESCKQQIIEAMEKTLKECKVPPYPLVASSHISSKDGTLQDLITNKDGNLNFENNYNTKMGKNKSDIKTEVLEKFDKVEVAHSSRSDVVEDCSVADWEYLLYRLFSVSSIFKSQYTVSSDPDANKFGEVILICKNLFEKDYLCYIIDNSGGVLSDNCPINMIVPVASRDVDSNFERLKSKIDKYEKMTKSGKSQLLVPVILLDDKFICRSDPMTVKDAQSEMSSSESSLPGRTGELGTSRRGASESTTMEVPMLDKNILNTLNVEWICDMELKDRKMIDESQKINGDVHCCFKMNHMSYPGCEFFRSYHDKKWEYAGLLFEWDKEGIDAILQLYNNSHAESLNIDLKNYKSWDIVKLTQNYMKILLSYIVQGTGGLLVHCISGRDRTPLIISLLRISLWADGVIHKSLNPTEMAYLTLGYDWFLFGHDLPKRFARHEEIMHFCFNFLPMINSDEYSVTKMFKEMKPEMKGDRNFPEFDAKRRTDLLKELRSSVLKPYTSLHVNIVRVNV